MRDMALQAAGVLAILVAIAHEAIGELQVFAKTRIDQPRARELLRMVWRASTVSWIGLGILLIIAPGFGSQMARQWIVAVASLVYGYAAAGNAIANRGRHIGWVLMVVVVVLALMGL